MSSKHWRQSAGRWGAHGSNSGWIWSYTWPSRQLVRSVHRNELPGPPADPNGIQDAHSLRSEDRLSRVQIVNRLGSGISIP